MNSEKKWVAIGLLIVLVVGFYLINSGSDIEESVDVLDDSVDVSEDDAALTGDAVRSMMQSKSLSSFLDLGEDEFMIVAGAKGASACEVCARPGVWDDGTCKKEGSACRCT